MKTLLRPSTLFTIRMEFPLGVADARMRQEQETGTQMESFPHILQTISFPRKQA